MSELEAAEKKFPPLTEVEIQPRQVKVEFKQILDSGLEAEVQVVKVLSLAEDGSEPWVLLVCHNELGSAATGWYKPDHLIVVR